MAWTEPQHTKVQVNAAGRVLVAGLYGRPEWTVDEWVNFNRAIDIIDNWRASHTFPLNTLQMNLRRSARRFDSAALIAQRVKRLISIANKLHRFPNMKLSQIQDIGGCRAVLTAVDQVEQLREYYLHTTNMKHQRATVDDYIPKLPPCSEGTGGSRGAKLTGDHAPTNHAIIEPSMLPWREIVQQALRA